jgi:F420-non-reducing hydrogenase large subunit
MAQELNQQAVTGTSSTRRITIDPITRLEGHGKIDILLNADGNVDHAYYQIPELRGFEVFSRGRPAEDMPQISSRICGVCPTAHHMAGTKALDDLYRVEPTPTAKKLRALIYNLFMVEDHALHIYVLGGPDFIVGPEAPKEKRNILGVIEAVGVETGKRVIALRRRVRERIAFLGGKVIHPVFGLPGGVAKGLAADELPLFKEVANEAVEFARFTLETFRTVVVQNEKHLRLITSDAFTHRTHYMGLVDNHDRVNFYDGSIRVVDPSGVEIAKFPVRDYADHIAEHVEPWSYVKFCYLKKIGWKGFVEGSDSGVYAVAPLARLNAASGMATPQAQRAYEEYMNVLGGRPVHHTLANHWARAIELLQAAEEANELVNDPQITGSDIRTIPANTPTVGIGVVEAPRGTLIHHYETDERGLITKVNLIVATQNNSARIAMGVDKAAKALIKNGKVDDGLLNMIEMAFRAYDPCNACATHAQGNIPLEVRILDHRGNIHARLRT